MEDNRPDPAIIVRSVYKIFGKNPASILRKLEAGVSKSDILKTHEHIVALRDVSFEVSRGEIFVIMGLSGSGKSTLVRHLNRLIEPTAGEILIDGRSVLDASVSELLELRRHRVSMVFQRFGLLPHKTVLENVAYGLEIAGVRREESRDRAIQQINLVGLAGFESRYPRQLSGGMQQRVGLARALATNAEVLLMDEAFSALDPLIRAEMQDQLASLQKRLRKTIVFITHDIAEALKLGDRIAILKDGEIRQQGRPEEIVLNPADDYVARFVEGGSSLAVVRVGKLVEQAPTIPVIASEEDQHEALRLSSTGVVYVLDPDQRPIGVIGRAASLKASEPLVRERIPEDMMVPSETLLLQTLQKIARATHPLPVVDREGRYLGVISARAVLQAMV